jgi:invasion protein IalB
MKLIKGFVKRVIVTAATAMMTLPGMAVGSALAAESPTDQWLKVCQKDEKAKKELCQTTYDELTGEARRMARVILPTGMLLQPGLKIQIDQGKSEDAKYAFCAPDGCFAEMLISDADFAALKKGKMLTVGAEGQAANPVSFNFSLDTFKSANEGKPLDPAEIKKHAEAVQQEYLSKRKSLEDQLKDAQHKAQQTE